MTRPDLRTAHARRTRAAIRAAALCLTRERGYVAMTVDDVAALAGVSRRTVFNHFSSKADLIVVGLDPPEPDDVEAFVSGTGALLEDLGSLLAAGAESVEPERDWLLACPEVVRDNPEVERAVHERLWAISSSLTEAVARRLGAAPDDPRVRAVVAMAMAIQRTAMAMWAGKGAADEPQRIRLADAVRTVTAALGDVLTASPAPAGPASAGLAPAGSVPRPTIPGSAPSSPWPWRSSAPPWACGPVRAVPAAGAGPGAPAPGPGATTRPGPGPGPGAGTATGAGRGRTPRIPRARRGPRARRAP